MTRMRERTTGELLMLGVAGTVCGSMLLTLVAIIAIHLLDPGADTTSAGIIVSETLNTLIGLLAGYTAGRTDLATQTMATGSSDDPVRDDNE